jgi:hypothetical protein
MTAPLTDNQRLALRNLARKEAGEEVGWINIGDAIALAEAGLCRRTAEGWKITAEGQAILSEAPPGPPDSSDILPMFANDAKSRT